jgi:hypothetical protein
MRLVIIDIQNPLDPQVNGFGLYRTVVDGTDLLTIDKVQIPAAQGPAFNTYSATNPWEAADAVDEGLIMVWPVASQFTNIAMTASQVWEIEGEMYRNSEDVSGYRCTHLWEIEFLENFLGAFTQTRYTWAYATIIEDDGLGEIVEDDNDIPVFSSLVAAFQEHVFIAGDPENANFLYWSKRFRPESYSLENYIEVGNADDPITQLAPIAGVLGVFTRATKYRVTGNATSGFVHWEAISHRGTTAPKSVVITDKGIIFASFDGIWITNLIGPDEKISDKIEPIFNPEQEDAEEPSINTDAFNQCVCSFHRNKLKFSYPSTGNTTNNKTAEYSFDTKEWTIYDIAAGSMMVEPDTNFQVMGGVDGGLYILESGLSDFGEKIEYDAKTKESYEGAGYGVRCLFLGFKVDANIPAGEVVSADFIVDGEVVHTIEISGDRTKELLPLPEGCWGYRWQIELTGETDKGLEIHDITALYLPLGVS